MVAKLTFHEHSRVFNGFKYVYPVLSRRAKGISLGINLNTNSACNWRCVYCQVDGLIRGKPDDVDLVRFETELDYMLQLIVNTNFIDEYAPDGLKRFNDISFSGNGEPTLSPQFAEVLDIVAKLKAKYTLNIKLITITNGSHLEDRHIQDSLIKMSKLNGEIWFKIDATNKDKISQVNQVDLSINNFQRRLALSTELITTKIQTCVFRFADGSYNISDFDEYWNMIAASANKIQLVMLYSIARNPALSEGSQLQSATEDYLDKFVDYLQNKQVTVERYL